MNRVTRTVVAAALLSIFNFAQAADKQPDATFNLSGGSVAAGVGYVWGHGTLHYKGADYPFSIDGLSVLDVGAQGIDAAGEVYNLSSIDDFAGSYSGLAAGAALVYGASSGVMENHSGVVVHVHSNTDGVDLKLSGNTMEVKLH